MGEAHEQPESAKAIAFERELVARWRNGDLAAFDALYHTHAPMLARRLRRVVGNVADTEDLLQQTFITAHKTLARFRSDAPLGPWLAGISFHLVGNYLRAKKRRRRRETGREEQALPNHEASGDAERQHVNRDLAHELYQKLQQLPDDKRLAFTLHHIEGLGVTEIGKLVGASPQTVWARIESARLRLEEMLHGAQQRGGRR